MPTKSKIRLAVVLLGLAASLPSLGQVPPPVTVPPSTNIPIYSGPGPLTNVYHRPGISFPYPQNWEITQQRGGAVLLAPPGSRRIASDRREHFSHGVLFGFFQPSQYVSPEQAVEALFNSNRRLSPSFREVGQRRSVEVKGTSAIFAGWTDTDPYLGEEGGLLLVVKESHGYWWWLMVAPQTDLEAYMPTFVGISGHVDFEQEPSSQVAEHTENGAVVDRIVARLRNSRLQLPSFQIMVINQAQLNAWADPRRDVVILPVLMVQFLQQDEGELAFVIAHELGHLQDKQCPLIAQQNAITIEGQKRFCEARADEIGIQYLIAAGYNPYDAAAFFGRMMMFRGNTSLLGNLVERFTSDHPIDMDRIGALRTLLVRLCQANPAACGSQ
jgi:hypothetical protein